MAYYPEMHAELKEQDKIIVDGGNGKPKIVAGSGAPTGLGGGAGGIIQILSLAGRLPPKGLSLKRGKATCFLDKKRLLSLNRFERSCLI